nr:tetratricopeptide repeat protein 16 [Dromaius novaehollandiae]
MEMEAGELFPTAVPEEQVQEGWERSLEKIFRPGQCLRSIEGPREASYLPVIVRDRMQEHWQKGLDFSSRGQWEEAVTCYSKAINLDPQRGRCLLDQELYCEALEAFTRAAELQPHCRVFRQRSIVCLAALNKFPECLQTVNRDLEEDGSNPDLYVLRASFYARFGQLALCHQDIQRALELEPRHGAAQALKQRLLKRSQEAKAEAVTKALCGDLRGALLKISFAIENDPLAADFFILRGTFLRRLKNFSAACEDFARARELGAEGGPEAQEAWRQLVLTYNDCAVRCYALGLFDEAVRLLGEALRDEKREKGLYVNRGDCFLRLGELAYALADYQQALELSPGDWGVRRRIAVVLHEQGQQDLAARRYQQAEARFSAAIKYDPHKPLYYLCRARTRVCRGRVESAKEDVALSLWLDPTDSEVLSLAHYLFPRKTIQAVLRSETGRLAKETLEKKLLCPAEPPVLAGLTRCKRRSRPPITLEGDLKEAAEPEEARGAWQDCENSISRCTSEYELYEELVTCGGIATRVSEQAGRELCWQEGTGYCGIPQGSVGDGCVRTPFCALPVRVEVRVCSCLV